MKGTPNIDAVNVESLGQFDSQSELDTHIANNIADPILHPERYHEFALLIKGFNYRPD